MCQLLFRPLWDHPQASQQVQIQARMASSSGHLLKLAQQAQRTITDLRKEASIPSLTTTNNIGRLHLPEEVVSPAIQEGSISQIQAGLVLAEWTQRHLS
jgi:hypothetical protein